MTRWIVFFLQMLLLCCVASSVDAAGSIKTDVMGRPLLWSRSVEFNPENGALKPGVFDHDDSVNLVENAFHVWLSIPGVDLTVKRGTVLPDGGNVNEANFAEYLESSPDSCYDNDPSTPCLSPVVFDEDGAIIDAIFGDCARFNVLAFAGFQDNSDARARPEDTVLKRGQALFSGACIEPLVQKGGCGACVRVLSDAEIRSIMIHEIGHLLGMDHAQVNPKAYQACGGGTCPEAVRQDFPTMFPVLMEGAEMEALHRDDAQYFLRLYGSESAKRSTCSVSGTVFQGDGTTPLRGVEVVARNDNPDLQSTDALAFVSGAQAPRDPQTGRCLQDCGNFLITGLNSGQSYQLCAQKIRSEFTEGSGIEPLDPPLQGFSDGCAAEISLQCVCDASGCSQFVNQNIVTDFNGLNQASNLTEDSGDAAAGGCSLAKPNRSTHVWRQIKSALFLL